MCLVALWTSPLLQRTVNLSEAANFGEKLFSWLLLPQLGLLTSEECGLVPGWRVRDIVRAKVKSEEETFFRWTYLAVICPDWRKSMFPGFMKLVDKDWPLLGTLGISALLCIIAECFILSGFRYPFAPPISSASMRILVNLKVIHSFCSQSWVHHRKMLSLSQMHLTPCYWRSMLIILHPMAQRKMTTNIACLNIWEWVVSIGVWP